MSRKAIGPYEPDIPTLRRLALKRARREVRGTLSDVADILLAYHLREVGRQFDAASLEGNALRYVPSVPEPRDLVRLAAKIILAGDGPPES